MRELYNDRYELPSKDIKRVDAPHHQHHHHDCVSLSLSLSLSRSIYLY